MENFYSKVIYDAMQLILSKQYKRAIVLCNFLIDKGFRTTELVIVLSYAYKMIEGPQKALDVLAEVTMNSKDSVSEAEKQGQLKSPLIDLARTQYEIENKRFEMALKSLEEFQLINDSSSQQSDPNTLLNFLKSLRDNYRSIFQSPKERNDSIGKNPSKQTPESSINIVQSFRKQINEVTQAYMIAQQGLSQTNELEPSQNAIRYGQFYLQYDEIKQKMLAILSNQLKVQSQTIFKVKTAKKRQTIYDGNKKLRKQNSKEVILKQNKPITGSLQKKKLNRSLDSDWIGNIDNPKEYEMSENQLEELQILLVQVNRFIGFFKNRLKNYSVSRVRQISPTKMRQLEQSVDK